MCLIAIENYEDFGFLAINPIFVVGLGFYQVNVSCKSYFNN